MVCVFGITFRNKLTKINAFSNMREHWKNNVFYAHMGTHKTMTQIRGQKSSGPANSLEVH